MTNISSRLSMPVYILGLLLLCIKAVSATTTSTEPEHMSKNKACLVILGASYAGGWGINDLMGCAVLNRGVDGNQSFEMNDRFENDVIAHQPQYVLLWGFINDIFRAEPDKLDQAVSRIKDSYRDMVTKARQHGIEPVLATEVTIRGRGGLKNSIMSIVGRILGKTSYQAFINGYVISTNEWLREFASKENLKLIDFESVLANSDGSRKAPYATEDGSHITEAAYKVLSTEARRQLAPAEQ